MATFDFITAEEHAALAEDARVGYEEFGEGFRKTIVVEDVTGLKSALDKQKNDIKTLTATAAETAARLAAYGDIVPEEHAALVAEKAAAEQAIADAAEKARLDAMSAETREAEIKRKAEADLAALRSESANISKAATATEAALKAKIDSMKLESLASSAAIGAGVIKEQIGNIMLITERFRARGENGEVVVLDESGLATDLTLKQFFETKFKEENPMFFPPLQSGGGSDPDTGGGGAVKKWSESSEKEHVAAHEKDPVAYEKWKNAG